MSKELEEAYRITALDFASNGDQEMYDFYMDKLVELTKIPEDICDEDLKRLTTNSELERNEKAFIKFINKIFRK